jgi:AAA+ superfamily predicted ATPase
MFLTTNRVTTFDDVFRSRITFAIKFDDLSINAKKTIWETFLQKVQTEKKISAKDIDGLTRKNMNGRQVR